MIILLRVGNSSPSNPKLHGSYCTDWPTHGLPPLLGTGSVHVRVRCLTPAHASAEHSLQFPQTLQLPCCTPNISHAFLPSHPTVLSTAKDRKHHFIQTQVDRTSWLQQSRKIKETSEKQAWYWEQRCSSHRKLVLLLLINSYYNLRTRGIVTEVCCNVLSKAIKPFIWDLTKSTNRPTGNRISVLAIKLCPQLCIPPLVSNVSLYTAWVINRVGRISDFGNK